MLGKPLTPDSAVQRRIKDGSRYDRYFPKPEGSKLLVKRDASVQDTVEMMKKIVKDYSYQTNQIATVLAVKDGNKLDIRRTAKAVWQFIYDYIKYNYEEGEQLQTPAHTWYQAQVLARIQPSKQHSADCDCMSIFSACIFHSLGIPCSFRIAGYANPLGITAGYQHVYVIVHDNGNDIIVDPVTNYFDYEKPPSIKSTFAMSLNGTDIYMLAGTESAPNVRVYDMSDPSTFGDLGGKRKEKRASKKAENQAKKAAKKKAKADKTAAKKEIKQAKKQIKQAKKSGDTTALQTAKALKAKAKGAKKEAKERIDANRTGISKVASKVAKVSKKTALLVPRAMFLLLIRLNFRGLARKFANNQEAYNRFASVWKSLGGAQSKLKNAIDKGKDKKALFGSKKTVGDLDTQLSEIGEVMYGLGWITDRYVEDMNLQGIFGSLGEATTVTVATAVSTATPIIAKVIDIMKQVGEFIPETEDEALSQGMEIETADDGRSISYNQADVDDNEIAYKSIAPAVQESASEVMETSEPDDYDYIDIEEYEEFYDDDSYYDDDEYEEYDDFDEEYEEMEGVGISGYSDGVYFVDDAMDANTGETLGKGLFKKVVSKAGSVVKNIKSKRKAKKEAKKANATSAPKQKKGIFKKIGTKVKTIVKGKAKPAVQPTQKPAVQPTQKPAPTTAIVPIQQQKIPTSTNITMDNSANNNQPKQGVWEKYKLPIILSGVAILAFAGYKMLSGGSQSSNGGKTLKSIELS